MSEDSADLLSVLLDQEQRLVFDGFDNATALQLGLLMIEKAQAAELPIAVAIRRNGHRLFQVALAGSSADNDSWIDRKSAVVDRYGHSSLFVSAQFQSRGRDFETHSRLDGNLFAAYGGSFPVNVRNVGCIGSITVSGLAQTDDHDFVVACLEEFLASR